ncbi:MULTISPECIES: NADP-dependent oxidoreductase [Thermomonosporaceae]|uniref:NADP-dependent oxidoreductase n=1 Tax=Thermomonosporaceae TaxID=2012 RepID=UPI00255A7645|nr:MULTISPECIES: NADP-dependent oxidoreductase [Thermomonosporaceae]MDL4772317.1 NADP-dependent oxidoreductase [Actinomadura xylanilytica]
MRAIAVSEYGATPSLMNVPRPEPGPGEILVKVVAAGLNPFDWKVVDGILKDTVEASFPIVLGTDGAGVVEEVGPDVTRFRPGEQVFGGFQDLARGTGTYAEYAIGREDAPIAQMPEGLIYTQAAAVPTASTTAFNLVREAQLDEDQTVLVVGATGGVGQAVVQLAANQGAKVIATAREDMAEEMRGLGAAEIVDHARGDLNGQVLAAHSDGIDTVIDMVSDKAGVERLTTLLRPGGTYLSTIWSLNPDALAAQEIRGVNLQNSSSTGLLEEVGDLIEAGKLKVRIHREVSLEEAPAALARNRAGSSRGKTVIRV